LRRLMQQNHNRRTGGNNSENVNTESTASSDAQTSESFPASPVELALETRELGSATVNKLTDVYYIVWNNKGELLLRSDGAPHVTYSEINQPEHSPFYSVARTRGIYRELVQANHLGWQIVVGRSMATEYMHQRNLLLLLVSSGGAILGFGLLVGWYVISRALRPIASMSSTAASISASNLTQRIDMRDTDSELGQLAGVLNQTFGRLQEAFERQTQFTADASHELRTPISVVLAQTQMALSKPREEKAYREALSSCQRAALRMKSLIDQLLTLARFDGANANPQHSLLDLEILVTEAGELLQPLAEEKGIVLAWNTITAPVWGDKNQLSQLLTNLIANAIRYNSENGKIELLLQVKEQQAILTVHDTGMGIPEESLPHVFDRFYRVDRVRSRNDGGSGLGLSICKAIVESHSGTINVESQLEQGTTVTVILPLAATPIPTPAITVEAMPESFAIQGATS
jgi:two-component system, OmpR family, sensor kinase